MFVVPTSCHVPGLGLIAETRLPADLDDISAGFRNARWELPWEVLVIGLGAVLIVLVTISARRWWVNRYVQPGPNILFSALARKAGLGWSARLLLWRIARHAGLSSPIALLIARGALAKHTRAYTAQLGGHAQKRIHRRVQAIQDHLHGTRSESA
jgi:hypothetical protein